MGRINMRKAHRFSSHMPPLMAAINMTDGAVLEMGTGYFSTPVIHWMCVPNKRYVLSLENDPGWEWTRAFAHEYHDFEMVADWDKVNIERPWSVAFIDHGPPERRRIDTLRLADHAQFIVIHDTNGRQDRHYHLHEIFPQFKYVYHFGGRFPQTTVLSNYVDFSLHPNTQQDT